MIPKKLWRTVPEQTDKTIEAWWEKSIEHHPTWECTTLRDPLDPADFPITGDHWQYCQHGAQMAGLIRLEIIWQHGGVYIDSDVEVFKPLDPLLGLQMFAAWEDPRVVPDAMFGAVPEHPAIWDMMEVAKVLVGMGMHPGETGPDVFTDILPERQDVTLFPPGTLYPYHYSEKHKRHARNRDYGYEWPWCYAAHHWRASWVK